MEKPMILRNGLVKSVAVFVPLIAATSAYPACPPALDYYKRPLAGEQPVHLCDMLRGKVVLVVNTASKCAYTPQYDGLEKLYARYREQGLVVAGFPSNDFYKNLATSTGEQPRWNFHKYLLDRDGRVVASFPSQVTPDDKRLINRIEELL